MAATNENRTGPLTLRKKVKDGDLRFFVKSREGGKHKILVEVGGITPLSRASLKSRRVVGRAPGRTIHLKPEVLQRAKLNKAKRSGQPAGLKSTGKQLALSEKDTNALDVIQRFIEDLNPRAPISRLNLSSMLATELTGQEIEILADRPEVHRILPNRTHFAGRSR